MVMRMISNAVVVFGILLSVVNYASSFIRSPSYHLSDPHFCKRNVLSMSDRNSLSGGRGGGRSFGGRGRGGGAGKGKPLDQREGSRALTRAELKAKEIYDATKEPEVVRVHAPEDRVALGALTVGQKLRGRIISVKEFGMFVDIGSKRDGLVHVKDISKDYFINNHQSKFIPGQDIDVWIKFVEEEGYKLGLQMFPVLDRPSARVNPITVSLDDISEQDEVTGTVVRVSNYGVFIDIGAGVDAFLHRRKMKLNKKSMVLKPWEVAPLGSIVKAFVHEVDGRRKRIGLTTYAPEQWNDMLPMKSDYEAPMVEDDEELGGSAMAENLRALGRTLSLNLSDRDGELEGEDDEDNDDEDDDDEGEELTAEEVRALTSGRTQQPQILIDDYSGKGIKDIAEGAAKGKGRGFANGLTAGAGAPPTDTEMQAERRRKQAMNDQAEEVSVEELFRELCVRGRDYVTVKDIKKWDYLQELMKDGELTDAMVISLFDEAGAVQGKLLEDQFEDFIDLLADELGLEEQGGEYDNGMTGDDEEETVEDVEVEVQDLVLMDDFASDPSPLPSPATAKVSRRTREQIEEDEMPDDMPADDMNNDFDEELDFGLGSTKLGTGPFADEKATAGASASASAETAPTAAGDADSSMSLSDHFERKSRTNDLFQYVFSSVAGKKGHVVIEDVIQWDFTQAILVQGQCSEEKIKAMFQKCKPVKGKLGITEFEQLVGMMSETEKQTKAQIESQFGIEEGDDDEEEVELKIEVAQSVSKKSRAGVVNLTPDSQRTDFIEIKPTPAISKQAEQEQSEGEEDEDDEELLSNVFKSLAGDKTYVAAKDLMNWDIVLELMGEGLLTDALLKEKMAECVGFNGKGVTVEGFDQLVDKLVLMYGEDGEDEVDVEVEEEDDDDEDETDGDEDEEEEGDYVDIDPAEIFATLSKGKEFLTFAELTEWDLLKDMKAAGDMSDKQLKEILKTAGVKNVKKMSLESFEDFLDELSDNMDDGDDDEDVEGMESEDIDDIDSNQS